MSIGFARLESAMSLLRTRSVVPGELDALPIGKSTDMESVCVSKDFEDRYHLLVRLPHGRMEFEPGLGRILPTRWIAGVRSSEDSYLMISCPEMALLRTFESLIAEFLDISETSSRFPLDDLMEVIDSWRRVLFSQRKALMRSRVVGLYGELVILRELVKNDPQKAPVVWRGPDNYRHDFYLKNAVEVKTLSGKQRNKVPIHGLSQMEAPDSGELHLVVVSISEAPSGESIIDLCNSIVAAGLPSGTLYSRLGIEMETVEEMLERFVVDEIRLFVVDEDFPAITRQTLDEWVARSIVDFEYSVLIENLRSELPYDQLESVLAGL